MALDEDEFTKILDSQIEDAAQWQEEHLAPDRQRNYEFYLGQNANPGPNGRSQAISWDVFETIEAAMPDFIEIFASGENFGVFEPVGEEDEAYAEQATDYINYVLQKQNPGFLIFNTWIKDALLSKIGVVRAYWAETEKTREKEYTDLTEMQLTMLLDQDEDAEITAQESKDDPEDVQRRQMMSQALNVMDPSIRMQAEAYLAQPVQRLYDVTIKSTQKKGRVYIDNVQPENFLVSRRAKTLQAADLVGELKMMSRSDMIEQGFKKADVKKVQSYDSVISETDGIAQTADDDAATWTDDEISPDDATEEVRVFDGFIRVDYNGDGIAEWRKVVRGGNILLVNEEADEPDFVTMSPILIPHRLVGMALADTVAPLQVTNTAMLRQFIDSLMLANNPRTYVNTAAGVNLDDLLNPTIGGIVRGTQPMQNALSPLVTNNVSQSALQAIEFMDTRREQRTGITRYNQGLDADSLNKTATGVTKIMTAGDRRKLYMARVMAETGIKDLFRLLLRLITTNQDKPATIRLRNEWVKVDPSPWSPEMDVTIDTGAGAGDKTQLLAALQMILGVQKEAIGAGMPLASMKNIYNTLEATLKAFGIKGVGKYFTDPGDEPQQPQGAPQETPEAALAAAQVKSAEIKAQVDMAKMQSDVAIRQKELEIETVKLRQQEVQLQIKQQELALKTAEAQQKAVIDDREQNRKDAETIGAMSQPTMIPV